MVIVTGHLLVEPTDREAYLDDCVSVVVQARSAPGCLDFSLSADLVESRRINILERWESRDAVEAFRGSGSSDEQNAMILTASVDEYEVATVRSVS